MTINTEKRNRDKYIVWMVLFLILSVMTNIVFNRLVGAMGLPLYIDNIGTLTAAAVGGYLPGIIVGYLTNIVNMTADPTNAYFAVVSAVIAIAGTFFLKKVSLISSTRC